IGPDPSGSTCGVACKTNSHLSAKPKLKIASDSPFVGPARRAPIGWNSISTSPTSATAASVPSNGRYAKAGTTQPTVHRPTRATAAARFGLDIRINQSTHLCWCPDMCAPLFAPVVAPDQSTQFCHSTLRYCARQGERSVQDLSAAIAQAVVLSVWQRLQAFGILIASVSVGQMKRKVWLRT